ncbi:hypothetical protein LTR53_004385 [Teratosphaeriaceae sp. CCFEE 6253]|nr:hypothetical protein LTR53_004385 [Teratosphaeriaceae sp. CCFEE 6253]
MAGFHDKENVAPLISSDPLQRRLSSPTKKAGKKARSKSIGPGDLEKPESVKQDAKNRRKSAFVPASRSIISTESEKAARQAARRQTLANRRVSFAPEATLHTWDVIEFMRDRTTSTDSSEQTRRASNITSAGGEGTPYDGPHAVSSDDEAVSTSPVEEEDAERIPASPALQKKQQRRVSGVPPMDFNNPEDEFSSSGVSGSSDASGSEDDEEDDETEDATGTAMSLDTADETVRSSESESSTSSSLTNRLQEAAQLAGTRGIEYDEHGEGTMSMEIAGEEITNAFKPGAERGQLQGSAALDQENVNPFSPAFKAQIVSGTVTRPATIEEENTGDLSMDMTRAVGGIMKTNVTQPASSPLGDGTMDLTVAVSKIHAGGQKRRRSTTEAGSPSAEAQTQPKRSRRSSVARSSMGDDTMDLTIAIGGIQDVQAPTPRERRKSASRRRSSGVTLETDDATMDFTQAVGGIKAMAARVEHTTSSIDENEELTMELTTVLGGIRAAESRAAVAAADPGAEPASDEGEEAEARLSTPRQSQSPARNAANTTPKDQERFMEPPDSGPRKLLTPLFQKQVKRSAEKSGSVDKRRQSIAPAKISWTGAVFDETQEPQQEPEIRFEPVPLRHGSPLKHEITYPELREQEAEVAIEPVASPARTPVRTPASARAAQQQLLDEQLQASQQSPTMEKVLRSSPSRAAMPEKSPAIAFAFTANDSPPRESRTLVDSIKLMSTPRKETLRNVTPKKSAAKHVSPLKHLTPRARPTPKPKSPVAKLSSPTKQLSDDMLRLDCSELPVVKIHLQDFLEDAGIRFMDLTASKRRLTTAPTPSKARRNAGTGDADEPAADPVLDLKSAIVAAAYSQPEHDMYQYACHELKQYISEGKKVIKQIGIDTYRDTPPLIRAYTTAPPERKAVLDAQMREMKTQARLRSKEMWYAWRSQLLGDLVTGLTGIAEGLLGDDEVLMRAQGVLDGVLPGELERGAGLRGVVEGLEGAAAATSEGEKEELESARKELVRVDVELEAKTRMLRDLQREARERDSSVADLQDSKTEFAAAIQEAERVRDACRGVSLNEIATLKDSIADLERTHGWSLTAASSTPPTVTMSYRSELQLFFHPAAFRTPSQETAATRPNAPISLVYIAQDRLQQPKELTTTLRFFLQLLRASLQALPQSTTRVVDLLGLVGSGWTTALSVAAAERELHLAMPTCARIVSDERLVIGCTILLPGVRTKVCVEFEVMAAVGGQEGGEEGKLALGSQVEAEVRVVYGERYHEAKMTRFVNERIAGGVAGWGQVCGELRGKLVLAGVKGFRK